MAYLQVKHWQLRSCHKSLLDAIGGVARPHVGRKMISEWGKDLDFVRQIVPQVGQPELSQDVSWQQIVE
jgi:hypothetical protein